MRISLFLGVCAFVSALSVTSAANWNVTNTGELQNALSAAAPGDQITLQAGATFAGPFTLPNKSGSGWITLQSSALASLPPAGTRVTPADSVNMPKIIAQFGDSAILMAPGAHNYQFIGLEIATGPNTYSYSMVTLGYGLETSLDQLPYNLVLDRLYIHGDPVVGTKRAITLNSGATVIKNCYISDIKSTDQDASAVQGWNGPGPYQILNNYMEATGENIIFGGATSMVPNVVPSDIEVRHNYLAKPLSWHPGDPSFAGTTWWVKNLFELKNSRRVVIDGNILENCWDSQQPGYAVLFTMRTEWMSMPWSVIEDVAFTNNIIRHVGAGFVVSGLDNDFSGKAQRILIRNNVLEDINSATWGGPGRLMLALNGIDYLTVDHNTAFQTNQILYSDDPVPNNGFVYTNNLTPFGDGISGSGMGVGTQSLSFYFPGSNVTRNVMIGGTPNGYPAGNFYPADVNAVGFQNYAGGDYHLSASSPYRNAGTDGKDLGADINSVNAATAGVKVNVPPPAGVPSVSINPAFMSVSAGQTVQFNAPIAGVANTTPIWRITPEIGTISATGLYTAPASVYAPTTVTVTAYSASDVTQSATATITLAVSGPQAIAPIRVNAGGLGYTESNGTVWATDFGMDVVGFVNNTTTTINGTFNPTLYTTQRYAPSMQYSYPVPNGTYTVKLRFAELTAKSPGARVFNVVLNGNTVDANLDVFAAAGGAFTALDKTYTVAVTNNKVVIQLVGLVSDAILNGLEVLPPGTTTAPSVFAPIRVNAGGPAVVDAAGNTWLADTGSHSGSTYFTTGTITGATTPQLYLSERWASGTLQYQFPVPNGTYTVNLKFAEIWATTPGARVFNIVLNGTPVATNFDIFAAVGGFAAIDKSYTVDVTNSFLTIQLVSVVGSAKVSAIEILQAGQTAPPAPPPPTPPPPTPPPTATVFSAIRVNAGGPSYVDPSGNTWAADTNTSGNTFALPLPIAGTTTPTLYQSERYSSGTIQYQFAVPNGTYTVNLKFAEIWENAAGARVFNIVLNGQTVTPNFDIFAAVGRLTAIDKSYTVNVTNGSIAIQLVPVISNAKINAIEILQGQVTPPAPPPVTTTFTPIRINAGGGSYVDTSGNAWAADTNTSGTAFGLPVPISGTTNPTLYQSERYSSSPLLYTFTVPNGTYTVNLKFAEIYFPTAGSRLFNIAINGQTVQSNFDIVAAAGGPLRAIDNSYTVVVSNGTISIQLLPVLNNAKISAIEILAGASTTTPPVTTAMTPIRVNAGGYSMTDAAGATWAADTGYTGGNTYSTTASISGTAMPALYQTERWAPASTLQYQFAVANGTRTVNLKFAEIYEVAAGRRVFNIVINGQTVAANVDIFAAAGGANRAIDMPYQVNVTGGVVTIQLVPVVSNPKINALEIY